MVRTRAFLLLSVLLLAAGGPTLLHSAPLPPPLRVFVPFDAAWNGMSEVLQILSWNVIETNRGQGHLLTNFKEFISGPLSADHIDKIGERPRLSDGSWRRVEFQYEIEIQLIAAAETLVTVNCNIRALKRDFFGREEWISIPTNGSREEHLLTEFGQLLFGQTFELDKPKKGFWERGKGMIPPPGGGVPNRERP